MRGLQALFNQDNGTGRCSRVAGELAGELRQGTEEDAAAAVMRRGSRLTRRFDASSPP